MEDDSTTDPEPSSLHRVRGVPTFIALRDGAEVGRSVGSRSPDQLTELFEAAASGNRFRGRISTTDHGMRLGVAVVFGIAAVATATPILWVFALAAAGFATWDLVRS